MLERQYLGAVRLSNSCRIHKNRRVGSRGLKLIMLMEVVFEVVMKRRQKVCYCNNCGIVYTYCSEVVWF